MILYHYTRIDYFENILAAGLIPLDEPKDYIVPPYCGAVWFTKCEDYLWANGRIPECRVTCVIPRSDNRLVLWKQWLRKNLSADEVVELISMRDEMRAPWCDLWETYYVYF